MDVFIYNLLLLHHRKIELELSFHEIVLNLFIYVKDGETLRFSDLLLKCLKGQACGNYLRNQENQSGFPLWSAEAQVLRASFKLLAEIGSEVEQSGPKHTF